MIFALTTYTGKMLARYWIQWGATQSAWGRLDDIDSIGAAYLMHDLAAHNTIKRLCHAFQVVSVRRAAVCSMWLLSSVYLSCTPHTRLIM